MARPGFPCGLSAQLCRSSIVALVCILSSLPLPAAENALNQIAAMTPRQFAEVQKKFQKAATMGDPAAQSNLATLYLNGSGVPKSAEAAAKWYEVAARQGDATAQNNLAFLYSAGDGVPLDKVRAAYWYRQAATQGDSMALNLGLLYEEGAGTPPDEKEALHWLELAARGGVPRGYSNQARLYMFGKQTPHDYARAYELLTKAIAGGDEVVRPWLQKCQQEMSKTQNSPEAAAAHASK